MHRPSRCKSLVTVDDLVLSDKLQTIEKFNFKINPLANHPNPSETLEYMDHLDFVVSHQQKDLNRSVHVLYPESEKETMAVWNSVRLYWEGVQQRYENIKQNKDNWAEVLGSSISDVTDQIVSLSSKWDKFFKDLESYYFPMKAFQAKSEAKPVSDDKFRIIAKNMIEQFTEFDLRSQLEERYDACIDNLEMILKTLEASGISCEGQPVDEAVVRDFFDLVMPNLQKSLNISIAPDKYEAFIRGANKQGQYVVYCKEGGTAENFTVGPNEKLEKRSADVEEFKVGDWVETPHVIGQVLDIINGGEQIQVRNDGNFGNCIYFSRELKKVSYDLPFNIGEEVNLLMLQNGGSLRGPFRVPITGVEKSSGKYTVEVTSTPISIGPDRKYVHVTPGHSTISKLEPPAVPMFKVGDWVLTPKKEIGQVVEVLNYGRIIVYVRVVHDGISEPFDLERIKKASFNLPFSLGEKVDWVMSTSETPAAVIRRVDISGRYIIDCEDKKNFIVMVRTEDLRKQVPVASKVEEQPVDAPSFNVGDWVLTPNNDLGQYAEALSNGMSTVKVKSKESNYAYMTHLLKKSPLKLPFNLGEEVGLVDSKHIVRISGSTGPYVRAKVCHVLSNGKYVVETVTNPPYFNEVDVLPDKIEPKFKVGDWVRNTATNEIGQITSLGESSVFVSYYHLDHPKKVDLSCVKKTEYTLKYSLGEIVKYSDVLLTSPILARIHRVTEEGLYFVKVGSGNNGFTIVDIGTTHRDVDVIVNPKQNRYIVE